MTVGGIGRKSKLQKEYVDCVWLKHKPVNGLTHPSWPRPGDFFTPLGRSVQKLLAEYSANCRYKDRRGRAVRPQC